MVLRREVRGHQVENSSDDSGRLILFTAGSDDDYEGLRGPPTISEDMPLRQETAREVQMENFFQEPDRAAQVFHQNLGDSSQSE